MPHKDPSHYQRRILLVMSGMSPQILTETLWALTQQRTHPWKPTEIHMLTTVSGARNARLNLLAPGTGHFLRFCHEYGLDAAIFPAHHIHCITDADQKPLEDIRTPEENEAAADFITDRVRAFTDDPEAALHVSMAGGRKTMGYYAGYALSLFGRVQDRLSHVLVSEPFEGLREFYFPSRESHLIQTNGGMVLDAHDARVTLAEIPFVRLRDDIPTILLEGRAGFSEAIHMAQRHSEPSRLVVDIPRKRLLASGVEITLTPLEFAFYAWIIRRQLDGAPEPGVRDFLDANTSFANELIALCERIEGEMGRDLERTRNGLCNGMERGFFDERKSRIKKLLVAQLGQNLAQRYEITGFGKRGSTKYTVPLEAEQIDWID